MIRRKRREESSPGGSRDARLTGLAWITVRLVYSPPNGLSGSGTQVPPQVTRVSISQSVGWINDTESGSSGSTERAAVTSYVNSSP